MTISAIERKENYALLKVLYLQISHVLQYSLPLFNLAKTANISWYQEQKRNTLLFV